MAAKDCCEGGFRDSGVFFLIAVVNLIPIAVISTLVNTVMTALNIIEKLLLLGTGMKALNQGTIAVPVVDDPINKLMS